MAASPDVLVATPGRVAACIREGTLTVAGLQQSLETLVLDEVRTELLIFRELDRFQNGKASSLEH